jgi:hypothetical protein
LTFGGSAVYCSEKTYNKDLIPGSDSDVYRLYFARFSEETAKIFHGVNRSPHKMDRFIISP